MSLSYLSPSTPRVQVRGFADRSRHDPEQKSARFLGKLKVLDKEFQMYEDSRRSREQSARQIPLPIFKSTTHLPPKPISRAPESPEDKEYWDALSNVLRGVKYSREKAERVLKRTPRNESEPGGQVVQTRNQIHNIIEDDLQKLREDRVQQRNQRKFEKSQKRRQMRDEDSQTLGDQAYNPDSVREMMKIIDELKERIALERKYPPTMQENLPPFQEFHADEDTPRVIGREERRALWRQRQKEQTRVKLTEHGPEVEANWKNQLDQLEETVREFQDRLDRYQNAGPDHGMPENMKPSDTARVVDGRRVTNGLTARTKGNFLTSGNLLDPIMEDHTVRNLPFIRKESYYDSRSAPDSIAEMQRARGTATSEETSGISRDARNSFEESKRAARPATGKEMATDSRGALDPIAELERASRSDGVETITGSERALWKLQAQRDALQVRRDALRNKLEAAVLKPTTPAPIPWEAPAEQAKEAAAQFHPGPEATLELLRARREALVQVQRAKHNELERLRTSLAMTEPTVRLHDVAHMTRATPAGDKARQPEEISQSAAFLKNFESKLNREERSLEAAQRMEGMLEDLQGQISPEPTDIEKPAEEDIQSEEDTTSPEPSVFGSSNKPASLTPPWPEPQKPAASLIDELKPQISSSEPIQIDQDLTINLEAPVRELQSQLYALSSRLSNAYPRIETLPYNVWTSSNRSTLRTWLKILISKWKSRFEDVPPSTMQGEGVDALLDQMVRDHNLSKDAALRMLKRWQEVFEWKGVPEHLRRAAEERLDEAELDAGLGWLRDEAGVGPEDDLGWNAGGKEIYTGTMVQKPAAEEPRGEVAEESLDLDEFVDDAGMGWLRDEADHRSEDIAPATEQPQQETPRLRPQDYGFSDNVAPVDGKKGSYSISPSRYSATSAVPSDYRSYSTSARSTPPSDKTGSSEATTKTSTDSVTSSLPATLSPTPSLPHLTSSGTAHMVSVSSKSHTLRTAIAAGTVHFSNSIALSLIRTNRLKKGDVLSVSRIAGIMAAKRCPDIVPLCHPIMLTHVGVDLDVFDGEGGKGFGGVAIEAKVQCEGQTGVEMEALTAVMASALSVVDMCKAVDKGMCISNTRVVLKEGGRSGVWKEDGWKSKCGIV
jgi:molybdenum cofactor biosynthesis protein MoaC